MKIMDKFELQQLRDLPIEGVAERLGMEVKRHKALCPFHDDHHASLSFNVRKNSYRCFVCDAHGGTIDLVMGVGKMGFREACEWLNSGFTFQVSSFNSPLSTDSKPSTLNSQLSFDASKYERFFERPWLSEAARHFLFEERRLDERVVRWCRLTSWRDRNGVDWLQIPYYNREGKLIGIQNRNLGVSSSKIQDSGDLKPETWNLKPEAPRFKFPRGAHCGIYNLPVLNRLRPCEALYITEGASDCWAMLSSGHKAIAIPSATLLSRQDKELLSSLSFSLSLTFHMFPDRDAPGERLFRQLQQVLPNLQHHQLPPDCKDYGEYFAKLKIEN